MLKIRRPLGRLIFNMGIAIPGKTVFLIETAPWFRSVWISRICHHSQLVTVLSIHATPSILSLSVSVYGPLHITFFISMSNGTHLVLSCALFCLVWKLDTLTFIRMRPSCRIQYHVSNWRVNCGAAIMKYIKVVKLEYISAIFVQNTNKISNNLMVPDMQRNSRYFIIVGNAK